VKGEKNFFDEVAEVLVAGSANITDPLVGVRVALIPRQKGKGAVDIVEEYSLGFGLGVCLSSSSSSFFRSC
jgi:hypothetical protein